jgi:hypothetical protein
MGSKPTHYTSEFAAFGNARLSGIGTIHANREINEMTKAERDGRHIRDGDYLPSDYCFGDDKEEVK